MISYPFKSDQRWVLQKKDAVFEDLSPTTESFGVLAQMGFGVVRGGPEVRFHEGSTRVPPEFHQGSTRVPRGSARAAGWCERQKEHRMLLGISPELV